MQKKKIFLHRVYPLLIFALCIVIMSEPMRADEKQPVQKAADLNKQVRDARRKAMRQFVESLRVLRRKESGDSPCKLVDRSVLYFTDAVYHPEIGEGSTWIWIDDGLPQAIAQVYNWGPKDHWVMGLYTLSSDRLAFDDGENISREFRMTDFRPQDIPGAPVPAKTQFARTRQVKQLARRFAASERRTFRDNQNRSLHHLRLLTQPIYRYSKKDADILDGAIFAFVHGGTNAQIVMLIEARIQSDGTTRWQVGFGRLNDADNFVHLDGREFWTEDKPQRPLPPDFPSNYFNKIIPWSVETSTTGNE